MKSISTFVKEVQFPSNAIPSFFIEVANLVYFKKISPTLRRLLAQRDYWLSGKL